MQNEHWTARPLSRFRQWGRALSGLVVASLSLLPAVAQTRYVDPAKLPRNPRVDKAYNSVSGIEFMVRIWSPDWKYSTPKDQVTKRLTEDLHDLQAAQAANPANEELLLLTGLTAHLAYNVDVANTYEVAIQSFAEADKRVPADFRPQWFAAAHECQSLEAKAGMEKMLVVEQKYDWQKLPVDFWDDYIWCSTITLMPSHTLRALDHVAQLGQSQQELSSMREIAEKRLTAPDPNAEYPAKEVWRYSAIGPEVKMTSTLCGIEFTASKDWQVKVGDFSNSTCSATVETGPYPSKTGQGVPTMLIMTRQSKPEESLTDFARSFLSKYPSAQLGSATACPVKECVAFDIQSKSTYSQEGGAHFLLVAFASDTPKYPGLALEQPTAPPGKGGGDEVKYYRPEARLNRLDGTLYTLVILDSNAAIFEKAKADYRRLFESLLVE